MQGMHTNPLCSVLLTEQYSYACRNTLGCKLATSHVNILVTSDFHGQEEKGQGRADLFCPFEL